MALVGDGGCVVGSDDDVSVSLCMFEFRNVVFLPGQVYTEQRGMEWMCSPTWSLWPFL